jgi:hypothetical protein
MNFPTALDTMIDAMTDLIIVLNDDVTQPQADAWMSAVRVFDPTDSNVAATVRDAIRDNCPHINV